MRPTTLALLLAVSTPALAVDWTQGNANPARTNCNDDIPGPTSPKIVYIHVGQEHYFAQPTPLKNRLVATGIGSFNTPSLLLLDPAETKDLVWNKIPPVLNQPLAGAAAVSNGRIIFGDGMHQTDGAALYCFDESGDFLWQYSQPGVLVHMEGQPAVVGDKILIGAGHGGVLCLDASQLSLDDKPIALADLKQLQAAKWKELQAKYEAVKKKDPDFAVPPTQDLLPRAKPKLLWQAGNGKNKQPQWHVDSDIIVQNDAVIVSSAYLDDERAGNRALYRLSLTDGSSVWRVPLSFNPWSGASVCNGRVFVGTSNIRYDPTLVPKAKGEIIAADLGTGDVLWRRSIPGGIMGAVSANDNHVVFTATDGQIRALDPKTGEPQWSYDAKEPLFAGVALSKTQVFSADIKGTVHALNLETGKPLWTLSLPSNPKINAPGMVYSSPILVNGTLYLGTCNLDTPGETKTVLVGISQNQ